MSIPNLEIEISFLEKRLSHFEDLLDLSIKNNEVPAITNPLLNEVNKLSEKLDELKRVNRIKTA